MKNFRNFITSTKRDNLRLFISLSIIAVFAVISLLVWQTTAEMQTAEQVSINGGSTPTLGNYQNTTVTLGANTTIAPDAAPTNTTSINVSTDTNFKGLLAANPTTGVVQVTNAGTAGTYTVTVKAFNGSEISTRTFTLTVGSGTACNGTTQFTNAPNVPSTVPISSVAIGDFNKDGNQDIALTAFTASPGMQTNNMVSIRLGNGSGGFNGMTNIEVAQAPNSIAIGDFNNDGNQDFAVASIFAVSVRLGDGMGNFSGGGNFNYPPGVNPNSIAIGDFNNDGNQDFATANGDTVSFRLGDGTGNFNNAIEMIGAREGSIVVGDVNNDGNQDLLTTRGNFGLSLVAVRLGDGTGNFSVTNEISVGSAPNKVAIGDFNNDGNQDFATANFNSASVSIRIGDGAGNFSGMTEVNPNNQPEDIAIGDFNNDGNQDFAAPSNITGTISIRFGNGAGGFSGMTQIPYANNARPRIVIGDFNNDGIQDLANTSSAFVTVRLGSCLITPTPTPTPTATPTPIPTATPTPSPTPTPNNVCTPSTTVTEGDLFPGGIVSFGVTSGSGSVTVDHVNAGTGLQSLTVVSSTNAVVNIPAFTPGTQMPVVVTFTPINPGLAVDFTLRAASTFHAANIRARCAEVCTPSTTVIEGDLFPGGIVSFGITSGAGSVTVDHVNAGTGLQSLTVVGTPVNAVVNIPAFTIGTTMPVVVTFTPIDPNQPVDFTLRAASTFHAANIRARCGTPPPRPVRK